MEVIEEMTVEGIAMEGVIPCMAVEVVVVGMAVEVEDRGDGSGGGDGRDYGGSDSGVMSIMIGHGTRCRNMQLAGLHFIILLHIHG